MSTIVLQIRGGSKDNLRIVFLFFFSTNICCNPSLKPPWQDSSNEGSQHNFHSELRNISQLSPKPPPRALDKREYLVIIRDNFCLFCIKTYDVTSHLNRLDETVRMRGHNIWF